MFFEALWSFQTCLSINSTTCLTVIVSLPLLDWAIVVIWSITFSILLDTFEIGSCDQIMTDVSPRSCWCGEWLECSKQFLSNCFKFLTWVTSIIISGHVSFLWWPGETTENQGQDLWLDWVSGQINIVLTSQNLSFCWVFFRYLNLVVVVHIKFSTNWSFTLYSILSLTNESFRALFSSSDWHRVLGFYQFF